MKKTRESLWNKAVLEKYLDSTAQIARKSVAKRNGEHTAENLENIWRGLTSEEKLFIEFLYLSGKRTAIALYEDTLFSALVSKGLLQTPPGVGTLFMQNLQTTFSIPIAVWESLQDSPDLFFSHNKNMKLHRSTELTQLFSSRIDTLLKGPSPGIDI